MTQEEPDPIPDAMRCSIRRCTVASVGIGFLWLFTILEVPREIEDDRNAMAIKGQEDNYRRRKDLRPPEDWQTLTFKCIKTNPQRRKTWLTVGISTVPRPGQNNLLYTLVSLFRAASKAEQKHLSVLVHLAASDLTRLQETIVRTSSLFSSQILAGQLILIGAAPDVSPTVAGTTDSACSRESYFKQSIDHAFLRSFATNLSHYFLVLEDNVFCAPNFVTHMLWQVNTTRPSPWVLLELSDMGSLGRLSHSRDLPALAHFLLIFPKEKPLDRLTPRFLVLLAQRNPSLCRSFFFYRRLSCASSGGQKAVPAQRKNPCGPDNPPGAIFTDMKAFDAHFPWEAYTLDDSFF